ncbi:UPF0183 protein CG7083 [Cimex lectularius]|uniref:Uncharacterized protein n=1 Tax=Cimex lectularius TaxID=79782 RepID=A0A8I6RBM0_CIMLE|nr:UPF0183 protein CG7083 [Cimex lectularius]
MLELEVMPERSLGCEQWEFILGMHFSQAVLILQSQVGVIKGIQVIYSDSNPLSKDLEIDLTQDGIRLKFDPISQRLKTIEVYNLKLVKLKYCGMLFNSTDVLPTMDQIEHSFGATLPGYFSPTSDDYIVYFRGVSFYFPVQKFQGEEGNKTVPMLWVGLMTIYTGSSERCDEIAPLPLSCYQGQVYLYRIGVLKEGRGRLRLCLYTTGATRSLEPKKENLTRTIALGECCQAVATSIGAPNRVFFKSEDKMRIHSPSNQRRAAEKSSDYFFNYFTLGFDVLFDAKTQKAKKFILHTNYPGHYNFNMYHRCEFLINLPVDRAPEGESSTIQVTAYTKWDAISDQLDASPRPVVLNRASSINTKNFFGATRCYGYRDYIFEVMPNQHIASVTIYQEDAI